MIPAGPCSAAAWNRPHSREARKYRVVGDTAAATVATWPAGPVALCNLHILGEIGWAYHHPEAGRQTTSVVGRGLLGIVTWQPAYHTTGPAA